MLEAAERAARFRTKKITQSAYKPQSSKRLQNPDGSSKKAATLPAGSSIDLTQAPPPARRRSMASPGPELREAEKAQLEAQRKEKARAERQARVESAREARRAERRTNAMSAPKERRTHKGRRHRISTQQVITSNGDQTESGSQSGDLSEPTTPARQKSGHSRLRQTPDTERDRRRTHGQGRSAPTATDEAALAKTVVTASSNAELAAAEQTATMKRRQKDREHRDSQGAVDKAAVNNETVERAEAVRAAAERQLAAERRVVVQKQAAAEKAAANQVAAEGKNGDKKKAAAKNAAAQQADMDAKLQAAAERRKTKASEHGQVKAKAVAAKAEVTKAAGPTRAGFELQVTPESGVAVGARVEAETALAEEETLMRAEFAELDLDGDGAVTQDELRSVMTSVHGAGASEETVQEAAEEMIEVFDLNKNGRISYNEFKTVTKQAEIPEEEVLAAIDGPGSEQPDSVPEKIDEASVMASARASAEDSSDVGDGNVQPKAASGAVVGTTFTAGVMEFAPPTAELPEHVVRRAELSGSDKSGSTSRASSARSIRSAHSARSVRSARGHPTTRLRSAGISPADSPRSVRSDRAPAAL